jgi:predicted RNase H-like HicB family nuclease
MEHELVFDVTQEADGGFVAECLSEPIFTEGDSWEDLRRNVLEAVGSYFFDGQKPSRVRLHLVRDELLAVI